MSSQWLQAAPDRPVHRDAKPFAMSLSAGELRFFVASARYLASRHTPRTIVGGQPVECSWADGHQFVRKTTRARHSSAQGPTNRRPGEEGIDTGMNTSETRRFVGPKGCWSGRRIDSVTSRTMAADSAGYRAANLRRWLLVMSRPRKRRAGDG